MYIKKIRDFINRHNLKLLRGIFLFMTITIVFHILYKQFFGLVSGKHFYVLSAEVLTDHVYYITAWINEALFGESMIRLDDLRNFRFFVVTDSGTVIRELSINRGCSGLKQFYQAFFLFLLYPGPARHKLWYIPVAFIAMQITNIVRIVFLSFTMVYAFQHWYFIHDWVARPMFYVVLFGLWLLWDKYFTRGARAHPEPSGNK